MGASQRRKGAAYEREVAARFSSAIGQQDFRRHLGQARDGGYDIRVGPLVVECKRRKQIAAVAQWMAQAEAACDPKAAPYADIPVVVCREDHGRDYIVLALEDFLALATPELQARVRFMREHAQRIAPAGAFVPSIYDRGLEPLADPDE